MSESQSCDVGPSANVCPHLLAYSATPRGGRESSRSDLDFPSCRFVSVLIDHFGPPCRPVVRATSDHRLSFTSSAHGVLSTMDTLASRMSAYAIGDEAERAAQARSDARMQEGAKLLTKVRSGVQQASCVARHSAPTAL